MAEKEPGTASPDTKLPEKAQESVHGETVQPAREDPPIREEDERREEKGGEAGQGD
jgi:hypothetical protein